MDKGNAPFSLKRALREAYAESVRDRFFLLRANGPWVAAYLLLSVLAGFIGTQTVKAAQSVGNLSAPSQTPILSVLSILLSLALAANLIVLCVRWHRSIVLGPNAGTERPGRREGRYFIRTLVVSLLLVVVFLVGGGLAAVGGRIALVAAFVGGAFLLLWFSRVLLVLPAAAVDRRDFRMAQAWKVGKNAAFRFGLGLALCALPFSLVSQGLWKLILTVYGEEWFSTAEGMAAALSHPAMVAYQTVSALLGFLTTLAVVAFLSVSYRMLVLEKPDVGAESPA